MAALHPAVAGSASGGRSGRRRPFRVGLLFAGELSLDLLGVRLTAVATCRTPRREREARAGVLGVRRPVGQKGLTPRGSRVVLSLVYKDVLVSHREGPSVHAACRLCGGSTRVHSDLTHITDEALKPSRELGVELRGQVVAQEIDALLKVALRDRAVKVEGVFLEFFVS